MVILAHLLPLLFGSLVHVLLIGFPRRLECWLQALGYGYLLGLGAVVLAISLLGPVPTASFPAIATLLAGASVICTVILRRRPRSSASSRANPVIEPPWTRWLLLVLAIWLLWRSWSLGTEVALRPMFPWDAWATWSVKAKSWYLDDAWRLFVGFDAWLVDPESRYLSAWFYPDAVPKLQVWLASSAGGWHDAAVLSLWPALWLAGIALLVGQVRAFGARWWQAALAGFAWASLPLVQTHVALAGYADLPMTLVFGAAAFALMRYAGGHGWRYALLALILTLMLPGIKQEGVLWLLVLGFGFIHARLPLRQRGWIAVTAIVLVLSWAVLIGLRVPLPGLGWVEAGWGYLRAPAIGVDLQLAWHPVGGEFVESLLLAPNWNLLWWLSPVVLAITARRWAQQATMAWMMTLGFCLMLFIFFFTDAAQWTKDLTAVNRVLMQITLAWVGWLALLMIRPMPADSAGRVSSTRSGNGVAAK